VPKCSADIPLTDAFREEIEAGVLAEEYARHAKELDEVRSKATSAAAKKSWRRARLARSCFAGGGN
jgi:hypothetical protein